MAEDFLLLQDGGFLELEDALGFLLLETSFSGTLIENPFATTDVPTHKNACERSGFRAYPGELIKEPYTDRMILKEFKDTDHDDRQPKHTHRDSRPMAVEQEDTFISTAITVDDL